MEKTVAGMGLGVALSLTPAPHPRPPSVLGLDSRRGCEDVQQPELKPDQKGGGTGLEPGLETRLALAGQHRLRPGH